jgi:hypothetical protein
MRSDAAESVAHFVKAMTGRSELPGQLKSASRPLSDPFFALRYNVSKWDYLMVKPVQMVQKLVKPGTPYDRAVGMVMLKQYGRYLRNYGVALGVNKLFNPDVNITDPSKSDFGRLKLWRTKEDDEGKETNDTSYVADMTGNELDPWRFIFRLAGSRPTQKANLTADEKQKEFFKDSTGEVFTNYVRSKLTPSFGVAVDLWDGKDYMGAAMPNASPANKQRAKERGRGVWTWGDYIRTQVTPMSAENTIQNARKFQILQDSKDAFKEEQVPREVAIVALASLVEFLGIRVYSPTKPKGSGVSPEAIKNALK